MIDILLLDPFVVYNYFSLFFAENEIWLNHHHLLAPPMVSKPSFGEYCL